MTKRYGAVPRWSGSVTEPVHVDTPDVTPCSVSVVGVPIGCHPNGPVTPDWRFITCTVMTLAGCAASGVLYVMPLNDSESLVASTGSNVATSVRVGDNGNTSARTMCES